MVQYKKILGHSRLIEQLERARQMNRVAHAYLFHGPEGVGKQQIAFAFASALNCLQADLAPCSACESCRKINQHVHPDVRLVTTEAQLVERGLLQLENQTPSRWIRNSQLDDLADIFHHKPLIGRYKVIIVDDAHNMHTQSQNRFLKTLEEPTRDTVIILVTSHPSALLPTIRSRCQALAFGPLARQQISDFLCSQGAETSQAKVIAAMAQGSLKRALQLKDEDHLQARNELIDRLNQAIEGDAADILSVAQELGASSRGRLELTLDFMEMWYRDLLFYKLNVSQSLLVNQDRQAEMDQSAQGTSGRALVDWIEKIRSIRRSLGFNANPLMAAEAMLFEMKEF